MQMDVRDVPVTLSRGNTTSVNDVPDTSLTFKDYRDRLAVPGRRMKDIS
jgi:hypothetical protein